MAGLTFHSPHAIFKKVITFNADIDMKCNYTSEHLTKCTTHRKCVDIHRNNSNRSIRVHNSTVAMPVNDYFRFCYSDADFVI